MKKTLTVLGLLAVTLGYSQESEHRGKVGINTEQPKATLDIKPNPQNSDENADTNEGILIPRLSKNRVAKMINPEVSTLVYVNSTTYTGTATKVAKINAEGFYFWNGTEWTKVIPTPLQNSTTNTINNNTVERAALTGDVTAPANNNSVTVKGIQGRPVTSDTPTSGQILKMSGSVWGLRYLDIKSDRSPDGWFGTCNATTVGAEWLLPDGRMVCTADNKIKFHGKAQVMHISDTPITVGSTINTYQSASTGLTIEDVQRYVSSYGAVFRDVVYVTGATGVSSLTSIPMQINALDEINQISTRGLPSSVNRFLAIFDERQDSALTGKYALVTINTNWAIRVK